MLIRFVVAALMAITSSWALAFESSEHKQLGDLAYHLALKIYCDRNVDAVCDKTSLEKWFYDPIGKSVNRASHPPLSYGDIVMCVDYFLTPEKLLAGRESGLIRRPNNDTSSHPGHGELFPERSSDMGFDYWVRCSPDTKNFEGARAGHVNHSHFQAELLTAQRTNHMLALMLRASDGNPFGAMVANAISDHYLQDSFAPGHITTWRARLTDIAANAYHDRNNRDGWPIQIDRAALANVSTIPGINSQVNLIATMLQQLYEDPCIRQHFFRSIDVTTDPGRQACDQLQVNEFERLDRMRSFVRRLNGSTGEVGNLSVRLRGDAHLWDEAQDEQRLVMLWTEVRSIFDILESHVSSTSASGEVRSIVLKDSFAKSSWQWDFDAAMKEERPSWDLFSITVAPSTISANIGPIRYVIPQREQDRIDKDSTWVDYRQFDRIWGVSFGVDNMTFGDAQNRKVLALETVVLGKASHARYSENWAVLAGIQPYFGPGKDGFALTTRLAWVRPETETSISAFVRALHLSRDGLPATWRPNVGLRLDLGFTSFLTSYLQGSRDAAVQLNGSVRSGWSIGAGLQFGAPTCRLPGASLMEQCH